MTKRIPLPRRKAEGEPGRHTIAGIRQARADADTAADTEATQFIGAISDETATLERVRDALRPDGPPAVFRACAHNGAHQLQTPLGGFPGYAGWNTDEDRKLIAGIHLGTDDEGHLVIDAKDPEWVKGLIQAAQVALAVLQNEGRRPA